MARALGAEYQMECCSGNGLVYTDNTLSASHCDWGDVPPTYLLRISRSIIDTLILQHFRYLLNCNSRLFSANVRTVNLRMLNGYRCPVIPMKWQQRLFCATDGESQTLVAPRLA